MAGAGQHHSGGRQDGGQACFVSHIPFPFLPAGGEDALHPAADLRFVQGEGGAGRGQPQLPLQLFQAVRHILRLQSSW